MKKTRWWLCLALGIVCSLPVLWIADLGIKHGFGQTVLSITLVLAFMVSLALVFAMPTPCGWHKFDSPK